MHAEARTIERVTLGDATSLSERFAEASAEERLEWAFATYGDGLTIASSFGAEDVVLIDMAHRISSDLRIFTLDTGRLPQETYDVMDRLRERYGTRFEVFAPRSEDVARLVEQKGPNSFYASIENRRECCHVRKVEPLRRALSGMQAWATGLRREQSVTRRNVPLFSVDYENGGLLKINPLLEWSEEAIWERIRERDIPFNALHTKGYPSIGCAPCTRAVQEGEDIRAGRWWWENPQARECGLHR